MSEPSDDTRRLVWDELVDSDRMCRYYGYLAHRFKRLNDFLRVSSIVLGVITLSAISYRLPGWIAFSAANLAALSFALSTIRGYSAKALRSNEIFRQLGRFNIEWELLWNNVSTMDDDTVLASWKKRRCLVVPYGPGFPAVCSLRGFRDSIRRGGVVLGASRLHGLDRRYEQRQPSGLEVSTSLSMSEGGEAVAAMQLQECFGPIVGTILFAKRCFRRKQEMNDVMDLVTSISRRCLAGGVLRDGDDVVRALRGVLGEQREASHTN